MGAPDEEGFTHLPARSRLSVEDPLSTKHTQPIRSTADLAADTFDTEEELEEFLAFTYSERRRDSL